MEGLDSSTMVSNFILLAEFVYTFRHWPYIILMILNLLNLDSIEQLTSKDVDIIFQGPVSGPGAPGTPIMPSPQGRSPFHILWSLWIIKWTSEPRSSFESSFFISSYSGQNPPFVNTHIYLCGISMLPVVLLWWHHEFMISNSQWLSYPSTMNRFTMNYSLLSLYITIFMFFFSQVLMVLTVLNSVLILLTIVSSKHLNNYLFLGLICY